METLQADLPEKLQEIEELDNQLVDLNKKNNEFKQKNEADFQNAIQHGLSPDDIHLEYKNQRDALIGSRAHWGIAPHDLSSLYDTT